MQGHAGGEISSLYERLLARTLALPGVSAASVASTLPGSGAGDVTTAYLDGTPDETRSRFGFTVVGVDYFRTLGIAIEAGRDFAPVDTDSSTLVVIVNRAAREAVQRDLEIELLGRRIGPDGPEGSLFEVVGVTAPSTTGAVSYTTPTLPSISRGHVPTWDRPL